MLNWNWTTVLVNSWGSIWQTTIVWYGIGGKSRNPLGLLFCETASLSPGAFVSRLNNKNSSTCETFLHSLQLFWNRQSTQQEVMYLFEILISTYRDGNEIVSIFCCKARLCTGHHLVFCFISDPEVEKAYVSTSWLQQSRPLCHLQRWIKPLLIK